MIVELLSDFTGYILIIAVVLYLLNHRWFETYINSIVLVIEIIAGVVVGFVLFLPTLLKGTLKAAATAILSIFLLAVYLITYVVPFVGRKTQPWTGRVEQTVYFSYLAFKAKRLREMMVEIVAEHDDRDLDFQDPERYREQLTEVKKDVKTRLETGETVLSLMLGAVLISAEVYGVQLFQFRFYGLPISLVVEIWLLAIAVSIIYRVSILEFLAYPSDAEFDSVEEMDVALAYQKGVALLDLVQGLTVILVFFYAVSNVKHETVKYVLERKYSEELPVTVWLPLAHRKRKD